MGVGRTQDTSQIVYSSWTYPLLLLRAALRGLTLRATLDGLALGVVLAAAAILAVTGPLATPTPDLARESVDPTLVEVGTTPIRLSDARAQAVSSAVAGPADADLEPATLFETGLLDEAADQVALAQRAEEAGLHQALEVQAQLALARRRILSTALLDLAVAKATSEEALRARYDRMAEEAAADELLHLRRILVSSREEAVEVAQKIAEGVPFATMARRRSLDMETRRDGGRLDPMRVSELPNDIRGAVRLLPVGATSAPVAGEQGWYLLCVDLRAAVRLPAFETMHDDLEARVRAEVVARTVADARASVPIRLADLDATLATGRTELASVAAALW